MRVRVRAQQARRWLRTPGLLRVRVRVRVRVRWLLTPGLQRGERALQLALERRDLRVDCLVNLHLVGVRAGVWGRG